MIFTMEKNLKLFLQKNALESNFYKMNALENHFYSRNALKNDF